MNREQLFENIMRKRSFLCVGLDTDVNKIPEFLFDREGDLDPIFEFNKNIIDATAEFCVAYKPNLAFYESLGLQGWDVLERTVEYIREKYPDQFPRCITSCPYYSGLYHNYRSFSIFLPSSSCLR